MICDWEASGEHERQNGVINWLLNSNESWTRFRTLVDLCRLPENHSRVLESRAVLLNDPRILSLIARASQRTTIPIQRHNDASHPIYALCTLADIGLHLDDPGMDGIVDSILNHQSEEGAFQSLLNIPRRFGGTGEDEWSWILCDAPTLLYALLAIGLEDFPPVQEAIEHLIESVDTNGWRCRASTELGKFRGPGRKADPCPMANVYALKALAMVPEMHTTPAVKSGVEAILWHWAHQAERKFYLFGIGTNFRKLKYPLIWYDILHVLFVLSHFQFVHEDPRFQEMLTAMLNQADSSGRYKASSMYRAWKEWSFANKREPSPWITYLVLNIQRRVLTSS